AAIFLLDGNPVQAKRADFRPEVAGELIAPVDFVGARRDLVAREIMHGFADRVRGFAEIEVEHPMRIGNHGRAASGANRAACSTQTYALEIGLSRAEIAEKETVRQLAASRAAECGKLPLAL